MAHARAVSLVELPDPCLLAVLQHCADDPATLHSAARAHSRLHQAAVLACSSLSTACMKRQRQVDSLLLYLLKHGQHIDSISFHGDSDRPVKFPQLTPNLQLTSLHFYKMTLQLQTEEWQHDALVLAVLPLKQLLLDNCVLVGGSKGLTLALSMLPKLEYLSISRIHRTDRRASSFSLAVLAQLPQLTYLELKKLRLLRPGLDAPFLQPLQTLTGLVYLHIHLEATSEGFSLGAGMLPASHLRYFHLEGDVVLEPGVLADKTELQHLRLGVRNLPGGAASAAQLLSELQHLQQLTFLDLQNSMRAAIGNPPASAFSALTASSRLQYLSISTCTLPAGIWQHMFPAGRQLPDLLELDIAGIWMPSCSFATAPHGSNLVRCCPGLRSLRMQSLDTTHDQLLPLRKLSSLRTLSLTAPAFDSNSQAVETVASLTGLKHLSVCALGTEDMLVLFQLTQLTNLTRLSYDGHLSGVLTRLVFTRKHPGDKPVWRQVLRLHLGHKNSQVAQQAAAALAE